MSFQIETRRLLLRDVREDDIPILVKQCAEPEARENILSFQSDEFYNKQDLANAMAWAKQPQRPHYKLSVTLKTDDTLIGSCMLTHAEPAGYETSLGWHYGNRFRNSGYATEAARALLDFGFEFIEVNEIFADCFANNSASIRIMEKIGMNPYWNLDLFNLMRGWWSYGESKPTVRHTISRKQWRAKAVQIKEISQNIYPPR